MNNVIPLEFEGRPVRFNANGWLHATLVETRRGNTAHKGTWLHPKLAVKFARWLSVDFEIWADEQIDRLLHGAPSALEDFNRTCKKYDERKSLASLHGRGLNEWRRDEPALGTDVDRGRELLQMTLGLNNPNIYALTQASA